MKVFIVVRARSAARSRGAGCAERFRAKRDEVCSLVTCGVLFGARRQARARGLQSSVVAMCSSARVGVGEGAEACSSTKSGRHGAILGSSVAFGSGYG